MEDYPANLIFVGNSLWKICLEIAGCLIIFVLLDYAFYYLNRLIQKNIENEKNKVAKCIDDVLQIWYNVMRRALL